MAAVNRHLRGETREVEVPVHGHTVIEKGDLLAIMRVNSTLKVTVTPETTADWYAYPLTTLSDATTNYFACQFGGIAMEGSKSGTTQTIPMATAGIFRYPLVATTGVTVGQLVCPATSAAKTFYTQQVVSKAASELTDEYQTQIGYVVKTEAGATNVDFNLVTQFSGVSYGYMR